MSYYTKFCREKKDLVKIIVVLALVVIGAFAPVIFLNQSYSQSWPLTPAQFEYEGKLGRITTIDPAAGFQQNWPVLKLSTDLIKKGIIPLWNPHLATGQPLAADSINYIFSPLTLGFFLPVAFWDIVLIMSLFFAGIFTVFFLRTLGLNSISSISGGIFYMLSGAFIWYLPHPHIAVMVFTPFILYSLEKIIQNKNPKYIVIASIAFSFGILGAHLESVILQLLLVGIYFSYRICYPLFLRYRLGKVVSSSGYEFLTKFNTRRILVWSILGFLGGLALSSFFIIPVYEFIENGNLARGTLTGTKYAEPYFLTTTFVPYSYGQTHEYWSLDMQNIGAWNSVWGYVGVFPLFFSLLGVFFSRFHWANLQYP